MFSTTPKQTDPPKDTPMPQAPNQQVPRTTQIPTVGSPYTLPTPRADLSSLFHGAQGEFVEPTVPVANPMAPVIELNTPPTTQQPIIEPPVLKNRKSGALFLQNQRLDAPKISTAEAYHRILSSIFTTDVFEWTDADLISWFRKFTHVDSNNNSPFFSTPALAELMVKERPSFKEDISKFKKDLKTKKGYELDTLLIKLTETIYRAYQPSVPTLIKLAIHFCTDNSSASDDSMLGLDASSTTLSLTTTFIEAYYQVEDSDLSAFEAETKSANNHKTRPSLNGVYADEPGYRRLCAEREVFTSEHTATKFDAIWINFWSMLKSRLCSGPKHIPDIDLAQRRRIINGDKHHPLCMQFTKDGLEPFHLWLNRYELADSAGRTFQAQTGYDCGLLLDDMGHLSIGMDALHQALVPMFTLVLLQHSVATIQVPRILPQLGILEPDRRLPDCSWSKAIELLSITYNLYDGSLSKPAFPLTTPRPIVSRSELARAKNTQQGSGPTAQTNPNGSQIKPCRWCKSADHSTCDCPSEERKNAGPCHAFARGTCRQSARNCKYKHIKPAQTLTTSPGTTTEVPSETSTSLVTGSIVPPNAAKIRPPDDYTKAKEGLCNVLTCGKPFRVEMDGEFGVKWYKEKGLFLPARCKSCIDGQIRNPPKVRFKPAGSLMCSAEDPESILCQSDPQPAHPLHVDICDVPLPPLPDWISTRSNFDRCTDKRPSNPAPPRITWDDWAEVQHEPPRYVGHMARSVSECKTDCVGNSVSLDPTAARSDLMSILHVDNTAPQAIATDPTSSDNAAAEADHEEDFYSAPQVTKRKNTATGSPWGSTMVNADVTPVAHEENAHPVALYDRLLIDLRSLPMTPDGQHSSSREMILRQHDVAEAYLQSTPLPAVEPIDPAYTLMTESGEWQGSMAEGSAAPTFSLPTPHDVHCALMDEFSGLLVHPASLDLARNAITEFLTVGVIIGDCNVSWNGSPMTLDSTASRLIFDVLCTDDKSEGLDRDSVELAHGFAQALVNLTSLSVAHDSSTNGSSATISFISDDLSLSAESDRSHLSGSDASSVLSSIVESQSAWANRVANKHGNGTTAKQPPRVSTRKRRQTNFFTPSPTGIVREKLSTGEFRAAVEDSDLDSAVILSDASGSTMVSSDGSSGVRALNFSLATMDIDGSRSCSHRVILFLIGHCGYLLGGPWFGNLGVPTIHTDHNELPINTAQRLTNSLFVKDSGSAALVYEGAVNTSVTDQYLRLHFYSRALGSLDDDDGVLNAITHMFPDSMNAIEWINPANITRFHESLREPIQRLRLPGCDLPDFR